MFSGQNQATAPIMEGCCSVSVTRDSRLAGALATYNVQSCALGFSKTFGSMQGSLGQIASSPMLRSPLSSDGMSMNFLRHMMSVCFIIIKLGGESLKDVESSWLHE